MFPLQTVLEWKPLSPCSAAARRHREGALPSSLQWRGSSGSGFRPCSSSWWAKHLQKEGGALRRGDRQRHESRDLAWRSQGPPTHPDSSLIPGKATSECPGVACPSFPIVTSHAQLGEIRACREIRAEAPGPRCGQPTLGLPLVQQRPAPTRRRRTWNAERGVGRRPREKASWAQGTCLCLATRGLNPRADVTPGVACARVHECVCEHPCATQARVGSDVQAEPQCLACPRQRLTPPGPSPLLGLPPEHGCLLPAGAPS